MTQAFNLAQLANNLNTSGQLDATDGLSGLVANSNLASSGTANSSSYLRGDRTWATLPGFGKILQVVQTARTDVGTGSGSSTPNTLSNFLSVSITPSSTSSRILILSSVSLMTAANTDAAGCNLMRNGSSIWIGDAAGSRMRNSMNVYNSDNDNTMAITINYVDSPSTTSAITYAIGLLSSNNQTVGFNRSINDGDISTNPRSASSIIAMEIGA